MKRKSCKSKIPCSGALPGGKGKSLCPEDVDRRQLRMGIAVEKEHTTSKSRACAIALDHLAEDKYYYTKLRKAKL
jgi:hypothetical protein